MAWRFYYDCEFVETGGAVRPTIDAVAAIEALRRGAEGA